jgi:hypothetical protein
MKRISTPMNVPTAMRIWANTMMTEVSITPTGGRNKATKARATPERRRMRAEADWIESR